MNRNSKPMANLDVAVEATVSSVAMKYGMGGGTVAAAIGWLSSSGAAVLIGIAVTVLGFIVNYVFQRRRDRREAIHADLQHQLELAEERRRQEMHEAQLRILNAKVPS